MALSLVDELIDKIEAPDDFDQGKTFLYKRIIEPNTRNNSVMMIIYGYIRLHILCSDTGTNDDICRLILEFYHDQLSNSRILKSKEIKYLMDLLREDINDIDINYDFHLLLNAKRDGFNDVIFHKLCDDKTPTIMIFNDEDNNIFGGFTKCLFNRFKESNWDENIDSDLSSFIFILRVLSSETDNNIELPLKFRIKPDMAGDAVYGPGDDCFGFGSDFAVFFAGRNEKNTLVQCLIWTHRELCSYEIGKYFPNDFGYNIITRTEHRFTHLTDYCSGDKIFSYACCICQSMYYLCYLVAIFARKSAPGTDLRFQLRKLILRLERIVLI